MQIAGNFPTIKKALLSMVPKKFMEERENHLAFTMAKLTRRMEAGKERPDLVEGLLRKRDEWVIRHHPLYLLRPRDSALGHQRRGPGQPLI